MKATYKPEEEKIEIADNETSSPYFDNIDNVIINTIQSISQIMVKASKDLDNIRDNTDYCLTIGYIIRCISVIQKLCELSLKDKL